MDNAIIFLTADNLRTLTVAMVEKAGSGHPGGAMGGADFISVLFTEYMHFDPGDRTWPYRDRFFLDPGHMSPMLYSMLSLFGVYSTEDLKNFRQWGSPTPGHPELDTKKGIENTSGPLGQGHAMAVGAAIAERFLAARFGETVAHKTYAYISDGGIQEEISQGAGRIAGHLGLHNLIMFFDANDVQLSTMVNEVSSEDTAKKYEAWGWRVYTIHGHDPDEIREALNKAVNEKEKPVLIIGKTIMGKGLRKDDGTSFEGQVSTHGQPVSKAGASVEKTLAGLGGDPSDPFKVFPEVEVFMQEVIRRKKKEAGDRRQSLKNWAAKHPDLAGMLENIVTGQSTPPDLTGISLKSNASTRAASGTILAHLAGKIDNLLVMSADLSNSDMTGDYLKKTHPINRHDFSGSFLHVGVSELTMAALANGMALHGLVPVCGTFFVFSDYMKPAIRMAALMELPVKYVFTHDSFRVGEDGPTHQPVEQEAQLRLMEHLKNHSGMNSLLVLRPADGAETLLAWEMALENGDTPTALILSRQSVKDIRPVTGVRQEQAKGSRKGAYIVLETGPRPDIIFVANGSEVSTILEGIELLLREHALNVRVVSAISEGLFRQQPASYQKEVFPGGVPVIGVTAGLPVTLLGFTGPDGLGIGLDHFGYSAPYPVLDEKFGFKAEYVAQAASAFIKKLSQRKKPV
jgi:transketolase